MAKNRASNNNPEKIMRVAFLGGLRFANGASMVSGPLGRGEYEHGRLSTMVYVAMRKEKNELNLCLFFKRQREQGGVYGDSNESFSMADRSMGF